MSSPSRRTVAASYNFKELAALCETIAKIPKKEKKREVLKNFIDIWRKKHKETYPESSDSPTETFFPFIRLLMPAADKDRPVYGIKEHTLANLYIEELGLLKSGTDAQTLLHWKKNKPRNATSTSDVSDFAGVAYFVLLNRLRKEQEMTVEEVNNHLDAIAEANLVGGAEKKGVTKEALHTMLRRTDAVEQKWLIRIILKDLKFGMSDDTILNIFHPDAKDLYDATSSVSAVCTRLHDPNVRLSEIEVSLFAPVRPMLADTWSPDRLRTALKGGTVYQAEVKYDGDRCQIHKKGKEFKYFSRAGNDNSDTLGASSTEGTLTQYIADCFNPTVNSFILDGELCAYNTAIKCIATKAESYSTKSLGGVPGDSVYQICFVAFDILLLDDKTVTALSLRQRMNLLKNVFQEEEGRLYFAKTKEVTTPDECYQYLNEAIDRNEEGIILKDPASVYKPNSRSAGWFKVKPEYVDSLSDQLDVLVVGAYYGSGRRTGSHPSHFLLAVAQDSEDPGAKPTKFLSFCKVGSGYTDKQLEEMGQKLNPAMREWSKTSKPAYLQLTPGDKEKADVWYEPDKSFIVKISAAQIIESDRFATNFTLRFPRMKEPRYDKPWYECLTFKQLIDLKEETSGRLGARDLTDDLVGDGGARKRTRVNRPAVVRLAEQFRPADLGEVQQQSGIFAGKTFLVAGGDAAHSKQDLERLIAENGGDCVQNSSSNLYCIVCQKMTLHVRNIIKQRSIDVVSPTWIVRCISQGKLVPMQPVDLISTNPKTAEVLKTAFDAFGDSYTEETDSDGVNNLFEEMNSKTKVHGSLTREELAEFEQEHFSDIPLLGLFRLISAYVENFQASEDLHSSMMPSMVKDLLIAYGAETKDDLGKDVTHVILPAICDDFRLDRIKAANRKLRKKFHLVTYNWVIDSIKNKTIQDERAYIPRASNVNETPVFKSAFVQ